MAKIELSLESNINSILAKGFLSGYKIPQPEMDALVLRIYNNFYSPHGEAVAREARYLWKTLHDREIVHRLFTVAYQIESEWREKNKTQTFIKIVTSTTAYEHVPLNQILNAPPHLIHSIKSIFSTMHRSEFEKTRYWDTVKTATLQHFGFECQATVGTIPCGCQSGLYVVPRTEIIVQGTEHESYKEDLTVLCERHKLLYVGRNGIEWENTTPAYE